MKKHNRDDLGLSVLWVNERNLKYDLWAVWCLLKNNPTHSSAEDIEVHQQIFKQDAKKIFKHKIQRNSVFYSSLQILLFISDIYIELSHTFAHIHFNRGDELLSDLSHETFSVSSGLCVAAVGEKEALPCAFLTEKLQCTAGRQRWNCSLALWTALLHPVQHQSSHISH